MVSQGLTVAAVLGRTILDPKCNSLGLCNGYQLGSDVIVPHRYNYDWSV